MIFGIAGGNPWGVTEENRIIHLSLIFADSGYYTPWDYYITKSNDEFLLGLRGGVEIITPNETYNLKLNNQVITCKKEDEVKTATKITGGNNDFLLPNKLEDSCDGLVGNIGGKDFNIRYKDIDLSNNTIVLQVEENPELIFNYGTGIISLKN